MKFVKKRTWNMAFAVAVALGLTAIVPARAYSAMLLSSKCLSQNSKTAVSGGSSGDSQQGIENFSLEQPTAGQASQTETMGSGQGSAQACSNNAPAKDAQP